MSAELDKKTESKQDWTSNAKSGMVRKALIPFCMRTMRIMQ